MLNLKSDTSPAWLEAVRDQLDDVLIDHAHCEMKAASTAMNLTTSYVERIELALQLSQIVNEELEHFQMVLDLLKRRGIKFRRLKPSSYGRRMIDLVRKQEPLRAVDRLLVAGLIEARSCERFAILRDGIGDAELSEFYAGLFESEARHHATYVHLAKLFAPEKAVHRRLDELADCEADIIARADTVTRVHSHRASSPG